MANLGVAVMGVAILGVERLACWGSTLPTDLKPTPVGHVIVTSPPHGPTRPYVPTIVLYAKESLLLVCQENPVGMWPHVEVRVDTCNHQQHHGHAHLWDGEGEGLSHSTDNTPATHTESLTAHIHACGGQCIITRALTSIVPRHSPRPAYSPLCNPQIPKQVSAECTQSRHVAPMHSRWSPAVVCVCPSPHRSAPTARAPRRARQAQSRECSERRTICFCCRACCTTGCCAGPTRRRGTFTTGTLVCPAIFLHPRARL